MLAPWKAGSLSVDCSGGDLHPNTAAALHLANQGGVTRFPDLLEFYTDGSAKDSSTGFRVVVVAQWLPDKVTRYLGAFGGSVCVDPESRFFAGANCHDSFSAELMALLWAMFWALAHFQAFGQPCISFRYDATVAGNVASGAWEHHSSDLGAKVRGVAHLLEHVVGAAGVKWQHVKGHAGHPWNSLADSVAGWVREGANTLIPSISCLWTCPVQATIPCTWQIDLARGNTAAHPASSRTGHPYCPGLRPGMGAH